MNPVDILNYRMVVTVVVVVVVEPVSSFTHICTFLDDLLFLCSSKYLSIKNKKSPRLSLDPSVTQIFLFVILICKIIGHGDQQAWNIPPKEGVLERD